MSVILDPNWSFRELVEAAWSVYASPMQFAGYRINVIKSWGNVVGKSTALARLHEFIAEHKTKTEAAKKAGMSYSTLRGIEKFYESLPDDFLILRIPINQKFGFNQKLDLEEDLHNEFKSVSSINPVRSIRNSFIKYAIGFLNAEGGRIFWGVQDISASVEGIPLSALERDKIRNGIQSCINNIQPKVDPSSFRTVFIEVENATPNTFVVITEIPKANTSRVYFSESGECWIRVNGLTQMIKGPAIQELVLSKQTHFA